MTDPAPNENIQERLVALTRDLILIPSIPSKPEERRRAFEFIKNHLEALEHIEVREFEKNGIPSLIAAPPGCYHPDILMCGHLDVILHPDVSSYRSHIADGRIYGPGAGDMKGALAVLLEVFRAIHSRSKNASLGIAVTADEETGGESGIGYLFNEAGVRCGEAMIPDGGLINEITIEEKGILHLRLECHGHSAHAARPWLGDNPLEKLIERLAGLRKYFEKFKQKGSHWYPTCSVTIMGTKNQTANRIPANAEAVLDIRFPPPHTVTKMLDKIKDILTPDVDMKILISAESTRFSPDAAYQRITEDVTGRKPVLVQDDGGSDARYIAAKGIPIMMSRPIVGNLHSEEEWIDIESMVQLYHIYERYLTEKLLNKQG